MQSPALARAGLDLGMAERLFQGEGGPRRDLAHPAHSGCISWQQEMQGMVQGG